MDDKPTGWSDIHCHLIPAIDDGARSEQESVEMARLAVTEGAEVVICTPHQLGNFRHNRGNDIRQRVAQLQTLLQRHNVPLQVLPGADVRIEDDMVDLLVQREVLTLGDHGQHVLLELPHELYFPLEGLLQQLQKHRMVGILSHPERNRAILRQPELIAPLIDAGCLMQVTTGSLTGSFGPDCQRLAEQMLTLGQVHFLATDAHGAKSRRPLWQQAVERSIELAGETATLLWCQENPRRVATGKGVTPGLVPVERPPRSSGWKFWRKASSP